MAGGTAISMLVVMKQHTFSDHHRLDSWCGGVICLTGVRVPHIVCVCNNNNANSRTILGIFDETGLLAGTVHP